MCEIVSDSRTVTLSIEELEADPHTVFRRYRAITPFVAHEAGGYMVLRSGDVELLVRDPRVRSTETEYPKLRGITEGALFDFFGESMLSANDAVHRRRRSPFSRRGSIIILTRSVCTRHLRRYTFPRDDTTLRCR